LAKDFTTQSEGALAKTCPTSRKASLNQDKSTYTSGEHEQLIELSSLLNSSYIISYLAWSGKMALISLLLILAQ
jgi:hypothetical protein